MQSTNAVPTFAQFCRDMREIGEQFADQYMNECRASGSEPAYNGDREQIVVAILIDAMSSALTPQQQHVEGVSLA